MPDGFDKYGRMTKAKTPSNDGIATFTSTPDGIVIDFPIPTKGYDGFGQLLKRDVSSWRDVKFIEMQAELKTQMQQAWQRLDYKTADRIADILGEPRPTDHEGLDRAKAKEA